MLPAKASDEEFKVYRDHPRLLLSERRLKLLHREKERDSVRFQQFRGVLQNSEALPEPGFAFALYYVTAADDNAAKRAVAWALDAKSTDLRQLAIVYDWCAPLLSQSDSGKRQHLAIGKKISDLLSKPVASSVSVADMSARALAFIAIAGEPTDTSAALHNILVTWWRGQLAPALESGKRILGPKDIYPVFEMAHAVRDNLTIDIIDDAPKYFRQLPAAEMLSYYPAVYQGSENDFRIPAFSGQGEPDLKAATLARAGELALTAYDPNSTESQFLQGWLSHDQFMLRGAFGAPYEFLWANPYQPGLSYYHEPLTLLDRIAGRLYIRSSWDDDATWLALRDGELQMADKNGIRQIGLNKESTGMLRVGATAVIPAASAKRFDIQADGPSEVFVIGLPPNKTYGIEVDDEELSEQDTGPSGILAIASNRTDKRTVRISPR